MSIVRDNLMNEEGYSPYCGNGSCPTSPRTYFNGSQFQCPHCRWVSRFPDEFIEEYKEKWDISDKPGAEPVIMMASYAPGNIGNRMVLSSFLSTQHVPMVCVLDEIECEPDLTLSGISRADLANKVFATIADPDPHLNSITLDSLATLSVRPDDPEDTNIYSLGKDRRPWYRRFEKNN